MRETPKSLLARRRDGEAVQTVSDIAALNKCTTWLTEASLARVETAVTIAEPGEEAGRRGDFSRRSAGSVIRSVVATLGPAGLGLLLLVWATAGLVFILWRQFLPLYLTTKGVSAVTPTSVTTPYLYSRYVYVAICAVPGPLAAALLIEVRFLGRRRTGALVSLATGVVMLASAAARSRDAMLALECVLSFLQYMGLAVITTYTVEIFGAPVRGAGVAAAQSSWRLFGLVAWIAAAYGKSSNGGAVWFSGAISVVMTAAWVLLPIETRAKAAA
jgi:uncharacterized membrane protein (DUF485 family)